LFDSFNVSIYDHTIIGDNVIIHAGTILGADAFTTKNALKDMTNYLVEELLSKIMGIAFVHNKGKTGDTIGEGTKIDNQVHVGHDTVIGKNV
jgi:UDP-3-O-[3-hydroxymyristoyl] glucosamine N-acyltransferase